MLEKYLQGGGIMLPGLICWGEHLCGVLYSKQMDGRGGRGMFNPWFQASLFLLSCSNLAAFSDA